MTCQERGIRPWAALAVLVVGAAAAACGGEPVESPEPRPEPTPVPTTILLGETDPDAMRRAVPALAARERAFLEALDASPPILPLDPAALDENRRLAQSLALANNRFVQLALSVPDGRPLRSEIIAVSPVAEGEAVDAAEPCPPDRCYRVTMYCHAENMTTEALVDVARAAVVDVGYRLETQPDLNDDLSAIAWDVALNTPEVLAELGAAAPDGVSADVERVLHRSACEQSRHLCAAPTFLVGDRALWVLTDLTEGKVVGMRWTHRPGEETVPPTEALLLGEHIDAMYCDRPRTLARGAWEMAYILTRSDGLRLTDVRFEGRPVLRSTKVVDWHVAYEREDGFGYSDSVGCPFFSSAAVPAMQDPEIVPIEVDGAPVGFSIVQDYVHPLWPAACMYNYRQHYQFFDDGRFRIAVASNGGGCGDDATYRPVLRIVPAGDAVGFAEWDGDGWRDWDAEGWRLQSEDTAYSDDGFQYRIRTGESSGYYLQPGRGQFGDGGRGDNAFLYVTAYDPAEGDDELVTLGACCNTDYRQGPEAFLEPDPEPVGDAAIAIWYVPQLKNDDTPGSEYCWASAEVEDGMYVTRTWSCYAGPMFVPFGDSP